MRLIKFYQSFPRMTLRTTFPNSVYIRKPLEFFKYASNKKKNKNFELHKMGRKPVHSSSVASAFPLNEANVEREIETT